MSAHRLDRLTAGMPIPFGGDRLTHVPEALAEAFRPGDHLVVVQETGALLHVPAAQQAAAARAVDRAHRAFHVMGLVSDDQVSAFFEAFAARLEADAPWAQIAAANAGDVAAAKAKGRSTTRLVASEAMLRGMIDGLRGWRDAPSRRGRTLERDG